MNYTKMGGKINIAEIAELDYFETVMIYGKKDDITFFYQKLPGGYIVTHQMWCNGGGGQMSSSSCFIEFNW